MGNPDNVIGYIEYLSDDGKIIGYVTPFTDVDKFRKEILKAAEVGMPITPVVFPDKMDKPLELPRDIYWPGGFRKEKRQTYEMVAAAMEKKRLGLCSKTLVAVPNHLTGQFASEALKLYPNANILVTTQRDFEKSNRKRFCAKIATGNYDIVVIGHSQFEKIPLSDARKAEFIRKQIDELEMQLESMDNSDSRLTVKQLESKKKQLKTKLSNLLDAPKRDDVVTFEELGADSLMVDEAHNFKNLMTVTKMHNIAGISTTESQKASDLFMKCQYLDEITGARGVTFVMAETRSRETLSSGCALPS